MSLLYYRWAVTFRQQIRDGRYTPITHVKDEAVTLWKQHSGMYDERCAVHVPTANGRGHTVKKSRRNGETEGEYRRRVRQERADPDTEPEVERG